VHSPEPPATEAITTVELADRVAELGRAIASDYERRFPVLVAVLLGSLPFLADLTRAISIPVEVDFLSLSRFGGGGRIRLGMDTSVTLSGRHVILVEDIIDTGLTLTVLRRMMQDRGAGSVATCALLDRSARRLVDVPLEYRGFQVGDEYLIGYGLDYRGRYRHLPSVWAMLDEAVFQKDPDVLHRSLKSSR
jgi:hypoxanthine phosphoribosyltransferase